jgi:hypothetical protein
MIEMVAFTIDKAHCLIVNPLTHLWYAINASQLLFHTFLKYVKLAKIIMIHS